MRVTRKGLKQHASVVLLVAFCFACVGVLLPVAGVLAAEPRKDHIRFKLAFGALVATEGGMQLEPVTDGAVLKSGDKFKIMLELERKCFVYVIYHNSQGDMNLLFPYSVEQFETDYQIAKKYFLPPRDAWYELDNHAGSETFYLIASPQRLRDVEYLFNQYDSAGPSRKRDIARQVLSSVDKLLAEHRQYTIVAEAPVTPDSTTRGVERSQGADPTDVSLLATEIRATEFYSKTFVIEHR